MERHVTLDINGDIDNHMSPEEELLWELYLFPAKALWHILDTSRNITKRALLLFG